MARSDPLTAYRAKRDFSISQEPSEGGNANESARSFVIQKHWATRLHYDFRLELDGTMKSWAVPKGPSLDPHDKRMAVHVEDHPIAYNTFEGDIPPGQYGAGKVIIWDRGTWIPDGDPRKDYRDGHLKFELRGEKLHGRWALVRMKPRGESKEAWLLIKEKDEHTRPAREYSVVDALPDSVGSKAARKRPAPAAKGKTKAASPRKRDGGSAAAPLREAVPAAMPDTLTPQLATLATQPPGDPEDWLYEVKFDGYRMLARVDPDHHVSLVTRNGYDWTYRMQPLAQALEKMHLAPGWLDGEVVVLNAQGIPDFQALQNAFDQAHAEKMVYYLFDVPFYDAHDLRKVPLAERKHFLAALLESPPSDTIRYSDAIAAAPTDVLASACRMGLEGVIAKRRDSTYASRRTADWLKLKCTQRQEFVVGGYTDPKGSRHGIGSLLLGVYAAQGELVYAGNVGTGFDRATLSDLEKKLRALEQRSSPFASAIAGSAKVHWVKPKLVAEVSFAEWTQSGRIRHAVFQGLRLDKAADAVIRQAPASLATPSSAPAELPGKIKISHPERVIDRTSGTTKLTLAQFYAQVAPLMLEHLKGRPASLVRAPDGIEGELFFQKHLDTDAMPGVNALDPKLDPDHSPLIEIARAEGLVSAAQMNVIEFHTWNAKKTAIDKPDRMTFDLDPGEGVAWQAMQEAALLVREFLTQLGLMAFVKTSGGKGLHIVVPLKRLHDWDTVKGFSQAIVQHLARTIPERFSAKSGPRNRVGKIFIDYLRNGFGATTVAAWSARARPGLGVSVPIEWREVETLRSSAEWTVANIATRIAVGNTPWDGYARAAQSLGRAMKTLGFAALDTA